MITVRDLMTPVGTYVRPEQCLTDVLALMRRNQHSSAVVCDEQQVLGLIRERDLVSALSEMLESNTLENRQAREVMLADPVCVAESASLLEALRLARERHQRHMPVLGDEGTLVGMITHTDIAHAYIKIMEHQSELVSLNRTLRAESLQDSLLQVANRRAMERDLSALAGRPEQHFAIALFDIDWFKKYNDYYGHMAGDRALQRVCSAIQSQLRCGDTLYRYGGEELLMLMLGTDRGGAMKAADRARDAVQQLAIEHVASPMGVVTISGGVACDPAADVDGLIAGADQALYQAKTRGRNRIAQARQTAAGSADSAELAVDES